MGEALQPRHEQHEKVILDAGHELPTHAQKPERAKRETTPEKLEQIRATAEQSAESAAGEKNPIEQLEKAEKATEPVMSPKAINRELQAVELNRELNHLRRKESPPERVLSRVIHQPVVRVVSEVTGKTVSRPSGLLGGGLVALLGSTGYLYYARHMGFQYNYLVFTALFAGGFVLGLVLELLVWLATTSRRHAAE